MKHSFDIRPWLKPALTCILGLCLIFRPGSLTTSIAWAAGIVIALVGAGKIVAFSPISTHSGISFGSAAV